jgi:hypothetical protein
MLRWVHGCAYAPGVRGVQRRSRTLYGHPDGFRGAQLLGVVLGVEAELQRPAQLHSIEQQPVGPCLP